VIFSGKFRNNEIVKVLVRPLSLLLLLFYLTGNAPFEILHQALHSHTGSIAHTDDREQDPCHRAIYHDDQEAGCGHSSHFVEKTKCTLCDIIFHRDEVCTVDVSVSLSDVCTEKYFFTYKADGQLLPALLPSRGPPGA
jgi:hypothetical protein